MFAVMAAERDNLYYEGDPVEVREGKCYLHDTVQFFKPCILLTSVLASLNRSTNFISLPGPVMQIKTKMNLPNHLVGTMTVLLCFS